MEISCSFWDPKKQREAKQTSRSGHKRPPALGSRQSAASRRPRRPLVQPSSTSSLSLRPGQLTRCHLGTVCFTFLLCQERNSSSLQTPAQIHSRRLMPEASSLRLEASTLPGALFHSLFPNTPTFATTSFLPVLVADQPPFLKSHHNRS